MLDFEILVEKDQTFLSTRSSNFSSSLHGQTSRLNSLSLSLPCARALVLVNYQRAGIAATSAYYLEADTGPEAPLSGPAFPSTRSGFINRADHDHDDIKLFCLSSENALSTGVLDTPFICCSASSYFYPPPIPLHSSSQLLPLLQHVPFSLCLLSSLLSEPILGRDFRR